MPAMTKSLTKGSGKGKKAPAYDLERLEADYRAGILTVREVGVRHGISHVRVQQLAKANRWQRDLTERIRQAAAATLVHQVEHRAKMAPVEAEVVEASAKAITDIVLNQRGDIARARKLAMNLMGELEEQGTTLDPAMFDRMLSAAGLSGTDAAALRRRIDSSLALGNRVNIAQQLVSVLDRTIALERAAFGVAMPGSEPPPDTPAPAFPSMDEFKARLAAVLQGAKS